jgi:hypothetical protein
MGRLGVSPAHQLTHTATSVDVADPHPLSAQLLFFEIHRPFQGEEILRSYSAFFGALRLPPVQTTPG